MASSSTPAAQNFAGAAPAAAAPSWTPTGGRTIRVCGPHVDSGKCHLETTYEPRAYSKKRDRKPITSLHTDYPGKPGFMGCYHLKSWTTEAAAIAAVDHFRAWVDGGRRVRTAAATLVSNKRAAFDDFALPERYSKRSNVAIRTVKAGARVFVMLALTTGACALPREAFNQQWNARSDPTRMLMSRGLSNATRATAVPMSLTRSFAMQSEICCACRQYV